MKLRPLHYLLPIACCLALSCHNDVVQTTTTPTGQKKAENEYDLIIAGGDIIDGTGAPRVRGDIGIKGDTIAAIGDLSRARGHQTIDAQGKVVAPGFIDVLGQSEGSVLIDPRLEGKVRQGVTTEVTGEGHSPGPINDIMAAEMNRTRPAGFPEVTWRSLAEYMKTVEERGSAINFAFYVGATNPREMVLGSVNRDPSPAEMEQMKKLVDQAMLDGAVGLSTALIYVPAVFAKTEEIIELARVVGKYDGGYFTHMRSESDAIDAAMDEAFRIAREARVPLNIYHLKIGGKHNWGKMKAIVARIEAEQKKGLDVKASVYPYTATATGLSALAPNWALEGGYEAFLARLRNPAERKKISDEIRDSSFYKRINGADGVLVRRVPNPQFVQYEGKRLSAIAAMMKEDPIEAALKLFEAGPTSPTAIYFSMSEEDVMTALKQPWVSIGADSGAVVGELRKAGAHPRAYGTFPRIIGHYVRDEKLFSLEEAVRKMTTEAASRVQISDRGALKVGMKADLVVFDPATVRDLSTYENPHQFSEGISDVVVNGVPILRKNEITGKLPGRILRGKGYQKGKA